VPTGFEHDFYSSVDDAAPIGGDTVLHSARTNGYGNVVHRDAEEASPATHFGNALDSALTASQHNSAQHSNPSRGAIARVWNYGVDEASLASSFFAPLVEGVLNSGGAV
jgi:hypothetical protein